MNQSFTDRVNPHSVHINALISYFIHSMFAMMSFLQPKAPQGRIPLKESSIADTVSSSLDREIPCIGTSCLKAASLKGMTLFQF